MGNASIVILMIDRRRYDATAPQLYFVFDVFNVWYFVLWDKAKVRHHLNLPKCQKVSSLCRVQNLTHSCTISTSFILTPTLLVPRKCHAVSSGRFWIMMLVKVTNSVATGSRILWSER